MIVTQSGYRSLSEIKSPAGLNLLRERLFPQNLSADNLSART
ncbi:hypothetical protein FB99_42040 (plasmid) [Pantoea agglomerans]|nr:hypothetical protein FB99_42040 [Pantoea agglomerans]